MCSIYEEELQKLRAGQIYDALHPSFLRRLEATRRIIHIFNSMSPDDNNGRESLLRSLFGKCGLKFHINQPFRCDYGDNIFIGENFFANFNLTILDEAEVRFGDNVFIGPNVSIYTACHPLDAETRNTGVEWAESVKIGNSVWIGGSVTILPGVVLGDNVVVGAGSVVTKSFPDNVVIAGNPAKIIRHLTPTSK